MQKRFLLSLITLTIVFLLLSGCQSAGISQAQYDQVTAQLADFQAKLNTAQSDLTRAQADKAAVDAQFKSAQAQITALQNQVSQTSLIGATPAETAAKIVKNYHDTHVYSAYDLFVCSDMASEVWNMLKAQNISAVVVVGNKDVGISDILLSNHAWVLASVGANDYLALETTGGYAVKKTEKPLYYVGWSFSSPADLKSYNDWIKEYNVRVGFRNQLNNEANKAISNTALYNKLVELRVAQETELNNLKTKISNLATPLSLN
jgi:hypothetical protein